MLMAEGLSEDYLREQPVEWLEWAQFHLDRRYRLRLVNEAVIHAQGTAASQSEEGNDAFQEMIQSVRGEDDEEMAYLLDPNAKTDVEALRRAGFGLRPPATPPTQTNPPAPPRPKEDPDG